MTHGGPADLSGEVEVGDVLVSIDGKSTAGMKKPEAAARLKGKAGELWFAVL